LPFKKFANRLISTGYDKCLTKIAVLVECFRLKNRFFQSFINSIFNERGLVMASDMTIPVGKGITATVHGNGDVTVKFEASAKGNFEPSSTGKRDIMKASGTLPNGMTLGSNLMHFAGYAKS
jgi:hypothetical protein